MANPFDGDDDLFAPIKFDESLFASKSPTPTKSAEHDPLKGLATSGDPVRRCCGRPTSLRC
jgi:hypothetical protein